MPIEGCDHIARHLRLLEEAAGTELFIDGELVVDGTLAATKAWVERGWRRGGERGTFHAFDVLAHDDWRSGGSDMPLYERKAVLQRIAAKPATMPAGQWDWQVHKRPLHFVTQARESRPERLVSRVGNGVNWAMATDPHGTPEILSRSLSDSDILARPLAYYEALRRESPVHFDNRLGKYLVSRFDDIWTVLRDPVLYSAGHGFHDIYGDENQRELIEILKRDGGGHFPDAIMSDPPYHTKIRRLMERAFTAHRVKTLEPGITRVVARIIDRFADRGVAEGIADFAVPLTIAIICEQLGLRNYDPDDIRRWSLAVTAQISHMQAREDFLANARSMCELQNFLIAEIRERMREPREDMINDLVYAKLDEDGTELTWEELVSLVRATLVGGHDTTSIALGKMLFVLATRPDIAEQLRNSLDDERLFTRFVEELLRHQSPVRGLPRTVMEDTELAGVGLKKGSLLILLWASANVDGFDRPREFDMERPNLQRHLAFGGGTHKCVGMALARMELKVAAREFVRQLDDIKLTIPADDVPFNPSVSMHSIAELPLTFSRRK
jgi:cytochrome P450